MNDDWLYIAVWSNIRDAFHGAVDELTKWCIEEIEPVADDVLRVLRVRIHVISAHNPDEEPFTERVFYFSPAALVRPGGIYCQMLKEHHLFLEERTWTVKTPNLSGMVATLLHMHCGLRKE